MHEQSLQFYDMMGYPLPQQSRFLEFKTALQEHENKDTIITLTSFPDHPIQEQLNHLVKTIGIRAKNIPYIEQIYLSGDVVFDPYNSTSIELVIVLSRERFWSGVVAIWLTQKILTLLCRKHCTRPIQISTLLEEWYLNIVNRVQNTYDVWTVYQLAHLVCIYDHYPDKINIRSENPRIQSLLVNIPFHQIINLDLTITTDSSPIKKWIESLMGGRIGSIFERILKYLSLVLLLLLRKLKIIHPQSQFFKHQLRLWPDRRLSTIILWKMLSKGY